MHQVVRTGGSIDRERVFERVGPAEQSYGYGWGLETWGTGGFGSAASASNQCYTRTWPLVIR